MSSTNENISKRLKELASIFLRLGLTAFGGPAAHIAMMHDEVVKRRKWLDEQQFLDLMGATNLIPGPNSTQMAIHMGLERAGWRGMIVSGSCFIFPSAILVTILTWLYVQYGTTSQAEWLFYGIKPVIIAIVLQALYMLGRKAVKGVLTSLVGIGVIAGYFFGINEILLIFLGGLLVMLLRNYNSLSGSRIFSFIAPVLGINLVALQSKEIALSTLFLVFFKIGAVLYGSGYVLLAFLEADFVETLGWITSQQLIDVVALGQVTPGPLLTTATSIGYLTAGIPGAVIATVGIFLPSFVLVAAVNPIIPRLRKSPLAGAALDGVNAASLGLMAAVTIQLARVSLIDPLTIIIALLCVGTLFFLRINSTWLIAGGGIVGILYGLI
ncbi:MAG: chromate efflux transporter [Candidatus Dadabacteria bacterium]|nr:chromate efflux transporter [Candidatus Dadabacteria bacterium]